MPLQLEDTTAGNFAHAQYQSGYVVQKKLVVLK